jgi:hypothetical protein
MTPTPTLSSRFAPLALAGVLALVLAAPGWASVASEQQQGAQILHAIQAGKLARTGLSNTQYERVGEYLMGRALGSNQAFQAMDSRMDAAMGQAAADRMYTYLGERYVGVNAPLPGRYAPMFGLMGSMMLGYHGQLAGMMSRYLSGQTSGGYTIGPGMMGAPYGTPVATSGGSGWPTGAVVAIAVLAAVLVTGALALALPKVRRRRSHHASPSAG